MEKDKVLLIYHNRDNDGILSGALMKAYFSQQEDTFVTALGYSYEDIDIDYFCACNHYVFCDVSPTIKWLGSEKTVKRIHNKEIKIEIYDHHLSRKNSLESIFTGTDCYQYFFEPDMCGAEIFINYHLEFFNNIHWFRTAQLIGAFDTWTFEKHLKDNDWFQSLTKENIVSFDAFFRTLKTPDDIYGFLTWTFGTPEQISYKPLLAWQDIFISIIDKGRLITEYQKIKQENDLENGLFLPPDIDRAIPELHDVFIYNGSRTFFLKEILEQKFRDCKIDICINYTVDLEKNVVRFSFVSFNPAIDVSYTALFFGGGGHAGAAGCQFSLREGLDYLADLSTFGKHFYYSIDYNLHGNNANPPRD
jgi:oligoribonuclease NrnB/cAMP/cGMP phosphodiesterase (DHH superfamily)